MQRVFDAHKHKTMHKTMATVRADDSHFFRVDVTELARTRIGDPADHLVVESWREGRGVRHVERR